MYLEDVLEILLEEQVIHVMDDEGDEYFRGYRGNLDGSPIPRLKVVGIFANYDKKEDVDDLEIIVKAKKGGKPNDY